MSRYHMRAYGPGGLRGFAYSGVITKTELAEELPLLPDKVIGWTNWNRIQLEVVIGHGPHSSMHTASCASFEELLGSVISVTSLVMDQLR